MNAVTQQRLKEVLRYEPDTGLFYWRRPPSTHPALQDYVAGGISTGYVLIKIDGRKYKGHRLAWLYVHGEWPDLDIDHSNCCPLDNRISNLRLATNSQNQANRLRDRDKDTPKGVRRLPSGKFQARITVDRVQILLGTFSTPEQAESEYLKASRRHYHEYARAS
ncbi:HNH endonuclease [Stenotrophomonas sp. 278]|uniref:HNH endonuclease n=1 Tax=Stenotrophomonas sp. 278 TaxID=2479851 RepID=UPI000F660FAF|nr:HNH endonuclease [Stenotrophomonas sp. 278]RRU23615.1 hypothetical protein EGJ34_02940 [Stenotrophomonas sp. 278]